jgi:RNA polymerase sigma-70 factor (ECF subfamily)
MLGRRMGGDRDDLDLLEKWRAGDSAAGAALFEAHFDGVRRFFRNKLAAEDVEDTIQRVFLACVESRDVFRGDSSFRTYVFTIARHELYRYLRRRGRDVVALGLDASVTSIHMLGISPSSAAARDEARDRVHEALRRLPVEQQVMLELKYWEDLATAEIAAIMEIPEATVRTRLFRARAALREALATAGPKALERALVAARP